MHSIKSTVSANKSCDFDGYERFGGPMHVFAIFIYWTYYWLWGSRLS